MLFIVPARFYHPSICIAISDYVAVAVNRFAQWVFAIFVVFPRPGVSVMEHLFSNLTTHLASSANCRTSLLTCPCSIPSDPVTHYTIVNFFKLIQ